jgi:hypothetical protein
MGLICLGKSHVLAAAVCLVLVFSLILNSHCYAIAKNTSVTVLSYSSYVSPTGHFVVLGEIRNTGSHALESVTLNVTVSASDGSTIAEGTTDAYVHNFLPQQKAPFYIDFGKIDFDAISKTSTFDISLYNAPPTNYDQYPDLSLNVDFNGIVNVAYVISGSITNIGNQTANDIKIYGTYYNAAGVVVAVGQVELKEPLTPNSSANFSLSEMDEAASLTTKISSYALLAQTSTQVFSVAPVSPSDTSQTLDSSLLTMGIVVIALIAVIAVVGVGLMVYFKKRKSGKVGSGE